MKKRVGTGVLALLIVSVIIILLLNTGSTKAFILGLVVSNDEVNKGDTIEFTATIEISAEDGILLIDELILILDGSEKIECRFYPNATIISGCNGISIEKISDAPSGYGYGYTEGTLSYKITLDSNQYTPGVYESSIIMKNEGEEFVQSGEDIMIFGNPDHLRGCSMRAEDGTVEILGEDYSGKSKLSFYIPKRSAVGGTGQLNIQSGWDRISYEFDIMDVENNNEDNATLIVSGKYHINRASKRNLNTKIIFSKKDNYMVNITNLGGDMFDVRNMLITFNSGCF